MTSMTVAAVANTTAADAGTSPRCVQLLRQPQDRLNAVRVFGVRSSETRPPMKGYEVLPGVVPEAARETALRHIHRDIVSHGLPQEWLGEWLWSAHWFPHLKWDDEITALLEHVPEPLRDGELCDPQILLQMPDEDGADGALTSHVDRTPDW